MPFGTAPYMSPEQLLGIRNDPRSDLFALGVLLYFFSTGVRPFGESETMCGMRRRLWRDPVPPRRLKPDYPPWLQEIVLRCLEIEPAWRYPTAAQLAFDLSHPDQVKLTKRSERLERDPLATVLRRRFNKDLTRSITLPATGDATSLRPRLSRSPSISTEGSRGAQRCAPRRRGTHSRDAAFRAAGLPQRAQARPDHAGFHARRTGPQQADRPSRRAEALGRASEARRSPSDACTCSKRSIRRTPSSNSSKPTRSIRYLIGARQNSLLRNLLGSVSAKVAAEAPCTVTIVRPGRTAEAGKS